MKKDPASECCAWVQHSEAGLCGDSQAAVCWRVCSAAAARACALASGPMATPSARTKRTSVTQRTPSRSAGSFPGAPWPGRQRWSINATPGRCHDHGLALGQAFRGRWRQYLNVRPGWAMRSIQALSWVGCQSCRTGANDHHVCCQELAHELFGHGVFTLLRFCQTIGLASAGAIASIVKWLGALTARSR